MTETPTAGATPDPTVDSTLAPDTTTAPAEETPTDTINVLDELDVHNGEPDRPMTVDAAGTTRIAGPPTDSFTPAQVDPTPEQVAHNQALHDAGVLTNPSDEGVPQATPSPLPTADTTAPVAPVETAPAAAETPVATPDPTVTTPAPTDQQQTEAAAVADADAQVAAQVEAERAAAAAAQAQADDAALAAAEAQQVHDEEVQS